MSRRASDLARRQVTEPQRRLSARYEHCDDVSLLDGSTLVVDFPQALHILWLVA